LLLSHKILRFRIILPESAETAAASSTALDLLAGDAVLSYCDARGENLMANVAAKEVASRDFDAF